MIIVEDTRNQIGKHKTLNDAMTAMGHKVIRSKLYVGDYALLNNQTVAIDTKADYVELAGNICGPQHDRFRRECERAKDVGIRLVIMIEEECMPEDWKPPRKRNGELVTKVLPNTLSKAMQTMHEKYDVEFQPCNKNAIALRIITELKKGEIK